MLLQFITTTILITLALILIIYDRDKELKEKHVTAIGQTLLGRNVGENSGLAKLHQTVLSFAFMFCAGLGALFAYTLLKYFIL